MTKNEVRKRLAALQAVATELVAGYRDLLDDMQATFDERSEAWQTGEKGDEWQDILTKVEDQADRLDDIVEYELP